MLNLLHYNLYANLVYSGMEAFLAGLPDRPSSTLPYGTKDRHSLTRYIAKVGKTIQTELGKITQVPVSRSDYDFSDGERQA